MDGWVLCVACVCFCVCVCVCVFLLWWGVGRDMRGGRERGTRRESVGECCIEGDEKMEGV